MWAMVGSNVCRMHGGKSPRARQVAARKIALAELQSDFDLYENREPWEVLRETLHVADVLLRKAMESGVHTPEDLETLAHSLNRAANLAKMNLDARGDERRTALRERQVLQMQDVFVRVLTGLDLTPAQQALVPVLLKREIGALMPKAIEAQVA